MNNCDITLWVKILATDQRLDEKKIFLVQRKDFPRIHPDVHWCTLTWQEVEWTIWFMYPCVFLYILVKGMYRTLALINQIFTVHA